MPNNYTGHICTSQLACKCGFEVESLKLNANSITILTIRVRRPDKSAGIITCDEDIALLTLHERYPVEHTSINDNTALVSRTESKPGRRQSANELSKKIMADAMVHSRLLTDDDVAEVLDAWQFNKSTDRNNVMPDDCKNMAPSG